MIDLFTAKDYENINLDYPDGYLEELYNQALKDLEEQQIINEQHKKLNGELREEIKELKEKTDNQEFLLISQGEELKELYSIINKSIEYLEQPYRDNFDFSKAICNYDGDKFKLKIKKWNDYSGEQIQIITKENETYLISSNKCYLVKEDD